MIVKLYCDNYLLHDTTTQNIRCCELKLKLKVNTSNTLTFSLLPNHENIDKIAKLTSMIRLYEDTELVFKGRVMETEETIKGIASFSCEGALGYLNDTVQPPKTYQDITIRNYLLDKLNYHNSMVEDNKRMYLGNVTVTNSTDNAYRIDNDYPNTLGNIQEKLVKRLGGYLDVRELDNKNYLDYLETYDRTCSQVIQFQENLLDLDKYVTAENIITALIPLGAKDSNDVKLTIASVNDGKTFVYDQDAVNRYGWIFGTEEWDDVTVPENLKNKAIVSLKEYVKEFLTLELTALDLSLIDVDIEKIRKGDMVRCISKPHKLDSFFFVEEISKDYTNIANSKIVLDKTIPTNSENVANTNRTLNKLQAGELTASFIDAMIKDQTELITGLKGGNVIWKYNSQGKPTDLLFMNTDDIKTATEVLRINKNGIGFSQTGVNGNYTSAWTLDGSFNASNITTGILQGIKIVCNSGNIGGLEVSKNELNYLRTNVPVGATVGNMLFEMPSKNNVGGDIFRWRLYDPTGQTDDIIGYLNAWGIGCQGGSFWNVDAGTVSANQYINKSLYWLKENIEKVDTAINDVLETEVYAFNYIDDRRKKYGFIIGSDKYKTSSKVQDGTGIDLYSSIALSFRAIQEQQKVIEELKEEIRSIKEAMTK